MTPPHRPPAWVWPVVAALLAVNLVADGLMVAGLIRIGSAARARHDAATGQVPAGGPGSFTAPVTTGSPVSLPQSCTQSQTGPTQARIPDSSPYAHSMSDISPGGHLVRLYAVRSASLVPIDGAGAPRRCDELVAELITELAPRNALAALDELLVFDAALDSDSFDPGEVEPHPDEVGHFRLTISLNGLTDAADLRYLIAHDVAHLIAENPTEVGTETSGCVWQIPAECVREGSFFGAYLHRFWETPLGEDWVRTVGWSDPADFQRVAHSFYRQHEDAFLTEYSVYDPSEDFAEAFATWCTSTTDGRVDPDGPAAAAGTATVAAQKVQWFDRSTPLGRLMSGPCARLRASGFEKPTI